MTRVVISQPMYFPWPGFMEHMALADVFIWLDDAQFSKGSYTNRIQVKLADERKWMSIPLAGKGNMTDIGELTAGKAGWENSHRELLRQSFRDYPCRNDALTVFDAAQGQEKLCETLILSAERPAKYLGVMPTKVLRSSAMQLDGKSWRRVLDMVKAVGGTRYITGHGAALYLDHEAFEAEGVAVEYIAYSRTPWQQGHGEFTPYVTCLDLIAAEGPAAREKLHPATLPWREFLAARAAAAAD